MKVDKIIKNAKIYTSNVDMPLVTALAVKDGKFVYVGDENGLSDYEGDVTDLGGKLIMPGIIDSHVHVTIPVGFEYADMGERIEPNGKQDALDIMEKRIKENPGFSTEILLLFIYEAKYLIRKIKLCLKFSTLFCILRLFPGHFSFKLFFPWTLRQTIQTGT